MTLKNVSFQISTTIPQTLPYNRHINFFQNTSGSTWTRFSHREDRGRTLLRNVDIHIYHTA